MTKFGQRLDGYFKIKERGSSVKVEVFAGIVTFLAMAYILTVNPFMMQGGFMGGGDSRTSSLIIATAFGAIIGTLLIAFLAKMPFAQAPGMGLNSQVGAIVVGGASGLALTYSNMMAIVLISGVIFLIISFVPVGKNKETGAMITLREKVFDGIPIALRTAIPVGIGLFIAFIGLQNSKIISADAGTMVALCDFTKLFTAGYGSDAFLAAANALVCIIGVIVIAVLAHFKVKGAILIGILAATIVGIPFGVANVDVLLGKSGVSWKFWENFADFFSMDPEKGAFGLVFSQGFKFTGANSASGIVTIIMLVVTFCMIDMFDTMGTVVGCATNAGLVDKNGKPLAYNRVMYSDSIATVAGAMLGTSTVTTFVESGSGIAEGGRTGLTSVITAGCFVLSIFLLPVFAFIPGAAAAAALIYVGVLMMRSVKNIDFSDPKFAVPAFVTILMMPFAYSITAGIGWGILSYVLISIICYIVDIIKYTAVSKKAAQESASGGQAAGTDGEGAETANADTLPSESAESESAPAMEKPKWPVSIVTGVIAALFIVYFFMPHSL